MEDRTEVLGFTPQKELIYNKLLPYSGCIDEESNRVLSEIKGSLARAIQLRDVKVGAGHWNGQLIRYIRLYGHKFTKADHLTLVNLMFELVTIPHLELSLVQKYASQLISLLKKKELLSREDLVFPWKPLYNLMESVVYSPYEPHGLQLFPSNIENTLKNLVKSCRIYFSLESTQEMLDEWRPLLCPFDVTIMKGLSYLELFLPTQLPPEHSDKGFRLWFDELINMWDSFHHSPSWESNLVSLFARIAHDSIGYIDWEPYISKIFNRFLRSFNLPVGTQAIQVGRTNSGYDIGPTLSWIVSILGAGSNCQDHIDKFFKTLQSFYHPSNLGKWNLKLSGLLMTFPKIFSRRIYRERYKKPSWETPIPETHKLTEAEITQFVGSMKPVVFTAMFSKYGSQDSAVALRHLANMRPELIVPSLLEKMYPAMETLTEPHRLIACMNCMVSVTRPMLRAGRWYPEGPSNVLPLLNLSLPGIDPNDTKKTLVTFQMISTFVAMVPLVDCSGAVHVRNDLTENERELCSATAQFEDFVLQFIDRIFALIENSSQEHDHVDTRKLNPEQSILEVGMASTFTSVLQQCSAPIYLEALERLYNFVTGNLFEAEVGGRFAANLCRAAAKIKPKVALKKFIPYFCNNIKNMLATHGDIVNEEQLDNSFMWNLLMLSQVVRCNGVELLVYREELLEVLLATLHLKCVKGYEIVGRMLRYMLRALTMYYSLDFQSIGGSFDRPFSEYLAIKDWAVSGDINDLQLSWHEPTSEEIAFASEIVHAVLEPELKVIKEIPAGSAIPREELLQRLNVILEVLLGGGVAMPMWKGEAVQIMESMVPLGRFHCLCAGREMEITLRGENLKAVIVDAIRPLLSHMMSCCEDDTKSLFQLLKIYETMLFFSGIHKIDFDGRWKSFHMVKSALEDKVRGGKKHIRALLIDRVTLQHELRILNSNERVFTEKHKELFEDMFKLSISRYSEVRKKAQSALLLGFINFPYSYRCLLSEIVKNVEDASVPEHQFKGALHIIMGNGKRNIAIKRSWEVMQVVWPAIVKAQHSEEPSILKIIDGIINRVAKSIETTAIKIQVTDSAVAVAGRLLEQTEKPCSCFTVATTEDLTKGLEFQSSRNIESEQIYHKLIDDLIELVENGNLNWKFSQMGMECLSLLLRDDIDMSVRGIRLFVKTLLHDSLYMRKLAIGSVSAIFKQQKRRHKTKAIDPYKLSGVQRPSTCTIDLQPGNRDDNSFLFYDSKTLPVTKDKWQQFVFVEKTHWGYYSWPVEMQVYAPMTEQPEVDRTREKLREGEIPVYDAFMNLDFVDKFVSFISMEENKGRDKFKNKHMTLFKGLFRNYGDTFLDIFKPHIERLMRDTSHDKHDSNRRCGMEMLSGLLRGTKHWPYEKMNAVWDWAIPLLGSTLSNITVETIDDCCCFFSIISESRDPRRLYRLFELLMDSPLSREGGSFGDSSRLYALQSALAQQEWRVPELLHRLLEYLQPHLAHQYKNVRDRIGSILSIIFLYDYQMHPQCDSISPKRKEFIEKILPQLELLKDIVEDTNGSGANNFPANPSPVASQSNSGPLEAEESNGEDDERKVAMRLCKTVLKWLSNAFGRLFLSAPPELFAFLPYLCTLENETKDTELKGECSLTLACMSQALIQIETLPVAFHTIREISGSKSWHARETVLGYLQVMVFCNFFTLHQARFIPDVKNIVFHLLCDDQLEVRQMASVTLSGLLHCGFLELDKDLIEHFKKLSKTKLQKRKKLSENFSLEAIIKRHAGVLGLCACVKAFPYTVPTNMPQILMGISDHVDDPQPIQMTVKKTLSDFRRTHYDNWHDHKQMFTDDQLVVLTDLLVSPSYYA